MKRLIATLIALATVLPLCAQSRYNYQKRSLFEALPITGRDVVFLGNSITDGGEWAELFGCKHIKNRGISADRADWMFDRLDPIVSGHPRKLFLMIGTNDLSAGRTPEDIVADITKIVDRFASESPRTKFYVQSILPVNPNIDGYSNRVVNKNELIVRTNELLRAMCSDKGIVYIDLHSVLSDAQGLLNSDYTNDGLHLMGSGYLLWRDTVKEYVR